MAIEVKICGVSTPEAIRAAVEGGARYVGFVFYPKSPRAVTPELARQLALTIPTGIRAVGLFVDPDDDLLERVLGTVPLDLIQLHGSETPERVAEIRRRWSIPVMKAIRIGGPADVESAAAYEGVADRLLFDARPPTNVASLPGGNGLAFDWSLVAGRRWLTPWMLSGGLSAENVAEAIRATGATAVDVSSGVEDRPGHKTSERIRAFLEAAAMHRSHGSP